jgi:hypothetical protein
MAVEDKYVNSDIVNGDKQSSDLGISTIMSRIATEETAAADDDGSVYRFFKAVPVSEVPVNLYLLHDAITGGTDFEIGLWETDTGTLIDADILLGTTDISSASTGFGVNGLGAIDVANIGLSFEDLINTVVGAGTVTYPTVDIGLIGNTVGSGVGSITMKLETK